MKKGLPIGTIIAVLLVAGIIIATNVNTDPTNEEIAELGSKKHPKDISVKLTDGKDEWEKASGSEKVTLAKQFIRNLETEGWLVSLSPEYFRSCVDSAFLEKRYPEEEKSIAHRMVVCGNEEPLKFFDQWR